jgi:hypothetical protein
MTIKDIINLLQSMKKELLPMSTDYRYGKSTQHGIWCYNQAIDDCISALSKITELIQTCVLCNGLGRIKDGMSNTSDAYRICPQCFGQSQIPKPEGKEEYFKLVKHNTDDQMNFGGCEDTRKYLISGDVYKGRKEVHSWHTKIFINGKPFNSVCFEEMSKVAEYRVALEHIAKYGCNGDEEIAREALKVTKE